VEVMEAELRVLNRRVHDQRTSHKEILQQRTRSVWVDGSTTENGRYDWSEWKDIPVVQED